tara:strand:- start:662 stop:787 length:126 start_codon:yes stop_codon:yes gene_type:complete
MKKHPYWMLGGVVGTVVLINLPLIIVGKLNEMACIAIPGGC